MSTPQTRLSAPAPAAAKLAPLGKTQLRGIAWAVPGREPGQTRNLRHLTWSGPGDYVHLCYGGVADEGTEHPAACPAAVPSRPRPPSTPTYPGSGYKRLIEGETSNAPGSARP